MTYDIRKLKLDDIDSQERKMGFGSVWTIHQSIAGFLPHSNIQLISDGCGLTISITVILDVNHATTIHLNLGGH